MSYKISAWPRANTIFLCRSSQWIPGHWPPLAIRGKPSAKVVQNENFCPKHCCCKVSFLVLLDEAPQGQEGQRWDRQRQFGMCSEGANMRNRRLMFVGRSTRSAHWRSRTSVSGSVTTLDPVPTTCTRSTVSSQGPMLSRLSTRIWLPDTEPDSGPFTYVVEMSRILRHH